MKMEDHPPVVECEDLKLHRVIDEKCNLVSWQERGVCLFEDDKAHRRLIACYWRCVWRDKIFEGGGLALHKNPAERNEEAWQKWGERDA